MVAIRHYSCFYLLPVDAISYTPGTLCCIVGAPSSKFSTLAEYSRERSGYMAEPVYLPLEGGFKFAHIQTIMKQSTSHKQTKHVGGNVDWEYMLESSVTKP